MNYQRTTLDNGLRLLTAHIPGMRSASVAFFLRVGSRYEPDSIAGISHFIEHMLFKGSQRYPTARLISEAIEGVGGMFNGSTGKELTSYTARVPGEHLPVVLDVLADMIRHSLFDAAEIEKERTVIIEELRASRDDPQEWSNLLIDEIMWPHLPLGRDDAGFEETVANIQRAQMLEYLDTHYRPNALVMSVTGNIDPEQVIGTVQRLFSEWEPGTLQNWQESLPVRDTLPVSLIKKDIEQANICLATLGSSYTSPDYYTILLINAILGDGMSSRLFQSIREEKGLAYDIGSYFNSYAETGNLVVSAGVEPAQTEKAVLAILEELARLSGTLVPADELERAKAYVRGGILLGLEGTQQVAAWLAGQECLRDAVMEVDELIERINQITAEDIQRVAQRCFDPAWRRLVVIGPQDPRGAQHFAKLLRRA